MANSDLFEVANQYKILTSLAAGAMAGALAKSVIAPLDRCKINFQVCNMPYSFSAAAKFLIESYKDNGLGSLWRGNSATLVRVVPFAAIQFCAHEQWRWILSVDKTNEPTPVRRYVAGSLAGVTANAMTYPLDLARARLAVSGKDEYKTLLDVFKKVYKLEGPARFFRGLGPTLLGAIPYAGTSFFTYESLKMVYYNKTGKHASTFERMLFGACSGLIGQSASYPLDIVRRRFQTSHDVSPNVTIMQIARSLIKNEGVIGGLYKGLSMNWIKGPIAVSISFTTFDTILRALRRLEIFQPKCDKSKLR